MAKKKTNKTSSGAVQIALALINNNLFMGMVMVVLLIAALEFGFTDQNFIGWVFDQVGGLFQAIGP